MRKLQLKQLFWYFELLRRARVAAGQTTDDDHDDDEQASRVEVVFPSLVILSPGKAEDVIKTLGLERRSQGVYAAPGDPSTLWLLAPRPRAELTGTLPVHRPPITGAAVLPFGGAERTRAAQPPPMIGPVATPEMFLREPRSEPAPVAPVEAETPVPEPSGQAEPAPSPAAYPLERCAAIAASARRRAGSPRPDGVLVHPREVMLEAASAEATVAQPLAPARRCPAGSCP